MKKNSYTYFNWLFIIVLFLLSSCFLNKKEKADRTDLMQNITTKFNILYNANKLLEEAERNRINSYKENYQQLLPVFIQPNETSIAANAKLMDSVVQKAITIINDKSDSKYLSDAYFLMAKANYEKGNYYNAAEFFTYVANTLHANNHDLLEASLSWKSRSLLRIGYLKQIPSILDSAFLAASVNKYPTALTAAARADYFIETHDNDGAIQALELAIETGKNRKEKLRWHYLLGQLLQSKHLYDQAFLHFDKVVKSNASFEMAFNAELQQIFMNKENGDTSLVNTVARLKKMVRNDKNRGFTDQIYHIIGETYLQYGQQEEALKSFNLSLRETSNNNFQKAITYLKIADLHFDKADYETAKHYYDSTATFINSNFPNYELIQAKINNLDNLVLHLNTISSQDQLQALAKLPEAERLTAIDSIFDRKKTIALIKKEDSSATKQNVTPIFQTEFAHHNTTGDNSGNSFYFNNPTAISAGLSTFKRRWGNRSLEDNWRLKNKNTTQTAINKEEDDMEHAADNELLALEEKENFVKAVPLTEEAVGESNKKIISSYLKLGEIYRDALHDKEAATKTYTTLLERFPALTEKDLVLYNLYRLYSELDNPQKEHYKNELLTSSSKSIYAKIIQDPSYLDKLDQESQVLNGLYNSAYDLYAKGHYEAVIRLTDSVITVIPAENKSAITGQLAYLKALAIGRTSTIDTLELALKDIQQKYPHNELIMPLVSQHLSYIDSNRVSLQERNIAIMDIVDGREQFVDEPILTKWPELSFGRTETVAPTVRRHLAGNLSKNQPEIKITPFNKSVDLNNSVKVATYQQGEHTNSFRDLELLPDSAVYYFVIEVENAKVNLSPSRYGIGQFNRGQYPATNLIHQLKRIEDDLQLIYIGKFYSFNEANDYSTHLLGQLKSIMKIPSESYQTFLITESYLQELSDFDKVSDYLVKFKEQ